MASSYDVLTSAAEQIQDFTEATRMSINDPLDQIRLLSSMAQFGFDPRVAVGADPIGIAPFRQAGRSNVWATTLRNTPGTYIGPDGTIKLRPAGGVRPVYTNSELTGYLDEPAATNLQVNSGNQTTSSFIIGPNTVDGGAVLAPSGMLTARRLRSGPSGPSLVYLARSVALAVQPSTTYTISVYVRVAAGTLTSLTGLTVDESDASNVMLGRTGVLNMSAASGNWRRWSRTFTTRSDAAFMQVYWADNWTVGVELDIWGAQIELGSTATSLIYTPAAAGATRAADMIQLVAYGSPSLTSKAVAAAESGTTALCRRAALLSLARAVADYEPSSVDEADRVLAQVASAFDAEIVLAADGGNDLSYTHFRRLRAAVVKDLAERSVNLPGVIDVECGESLPAAVHAQRLYGDGKRADEIVQSVDMPHPLFCPLKFRAPSV